MRPAEADSCRLRKRQELMGWHTSFGDLLTLLLCFFIAAIALGPLGVGGKGHDFKTLKADFGTSPGQYPNGVSNTDGGTVLASALTEAHPASSPGGSGFERRIYIAEQAFGPLGSKLSRRARSKLKHSLRFDGSAALSAGVETCCRGIAQENELGWRRSAKRALHLRRLLATAGWHAARIELRAWGGYCRALSSPAQAVSDAAALIRLDFRRRNNG